MINVMQFICPVGFYGAERWILMLARAFDDFPVRCDLVVVREQGVPELEIVKRFSGHVTQIETKGRFDPSAVSKLRQLLIERHVDVLHTHGYKSDLIGLVAARLAGVRCISTPHGFGETRHMNLLRRLYHYTGGYALRWFDCVAPLSPELVEEVLAFRVNSEKIEYIENAVDLTDLPSAQDAAVVLPTELLGRRIVAFAGQLIPRKRVDVIIEIFAQVADRHDSLSLMIMGEGPSRTALEQLAIETGHGESIHFLGFREDRLYLLKESSLFVMASSQEGIPRVMMEAMALGIPIVAFNIAGIDILIDSEMDGLLAPNEDREALMDSWLRVLEDPQLASRLGKAAMSKVHAKYSQERLSKQYMSLYENLLKNG